MKASYSKHKELCVRLDESDDCTRDDVCEYVLDKLCADYDCELVGRAYHVGNYAAQDFVSRRTWKLYTLEFGKWMRLYYRERVRMFPKLIPLETMEAMGYPTDEESLKKMGLKERGGYLTRGKIPCIATSTATTAPTTL